VCCDNFDQALKDGIIAILNKSYLEDGRIMNMVESQYYLRREKRDNISYDYYGINFCPFCGMGISFVAQGFYG
jgi:hypothetical protein